MLVLVVIVVVMVVMMLVLVVIVVIMVVMMLVLVLVLVVIIMVMMVVIVLCGFLKKRLQLIIYGILLRHSVGYLHASKLIPLRRYDSSLRVLFAQALYALIELFLRKTRRVAQNKAARVGYLVVEEFAEVLHIHLVLLRVNNRSKAVELNIVHIYVLHRSDNVAELADTGGFDKHAIGPVLTDNLFERGLEIADKAAADTAGVHFGYLNAGILQKSAVNADLSEFVLDKHELFALVAFGYQLLYESCFSRSEKSRKNCDLCHFTFSCLLLFLVMPVLL